MKELGSGVQSAGFRVQEFGRVQGLRFRVSVGSSGHSRVKRTRSPKP